MAGESERILAAGTTGNTEKSINPDTFVTQIKACLSQLSE
jgi:hypothetical protein